MEWKKKTAWSRACALCWLRSWRWTQSRAVPAQSNNADAQRVSLAAGAPFAPWRRDHWGAGAYLLSRAGAAACADPSTFSPRLGKLVADEAVF